MIAKRVTVFASGTGSNFKTLHKAALRGEIPAEITALISDNERAGALDYAREQNISTHVLHPHRFNSEAAYTASLAELLENQHPDLIVLAGYLKKIPGEIVRRYPRKIINIHPALLPKYGGKGCYGMHVHRAVLQHGDRESGCTIHYVTEQYDEGPVIARRVVPVHAHDSPEDLAKRVQEQEHELYPQVVRQLLSG